MIDPIKAKIQERERQRTYKTTHKEVMSAQRRRYYLKHKERIDAQHQVYSANGGNYRRYGITLADYNEMLAVQKGLCLICTEPETAKFKDGRIKRLSVDHDHKTGKVRGLLCNPCNRGIGYLRDSLPIIKGALNYLETYAN